MTCDWTCTELAWTESVLELTTAELGIETELELDSTEFELIETLETWLEITELTVELELELDNSVLDICEFLLWELKMIALPDMINTEVIIARMILSLFDIEWFESFELLTDTQLLLGFWQVWELAE